MRTAEYVLYSPSLRRYLGIDNASGGYPWLSTYLFSAFISADIAQLKKIKQDVQFGKFSYLGSRDWVLSELHMLAPEGDG